ncbi:MAG TPA: hypothetical protein ENN06_11025 [Desulfobacteraceae bacterium]|nr:hypothetical protein [Desulfobacteraceae bacterium]
MSLIGEYTIECNEGRLILHPNLPHAQCLLSHPAGILPLCPRYEPESGQYLLPFGYSRSMDTLLHIVDSLGDRILQGVSRFRKNKAALLKLCFNAGRPAVELMEDCPALIGLIAARLDAALPIREYTEKAAQLVRRKRKEILSSLSYPASRSVIRLLRKIPAADRESAHLEAFRKIIVAGNPGKIKILRHALHINWLVVQLLSEKYFPARVHRSFVLETGGLADPEAIEEVWLRIAEMDRIIETAGCELFVPPLRGLESLEPVHDILVDEYLEARRYKEIARLTFSEPPLPGMEIANDTAVSCGVFPLKNGMELLSEGVEMDHCIATYAHDIVEENGGLYAYHVQLPRKPPATFLIRKSPLHGTMRVQEIRGRSNSTVDSAVELFVNDWLARSEAGRDREAASGNAELSGAEQT